MQPLSTQDKALNSVIKNTEKELSDKYELILVGSGGSCDEHRKETEIALSFALYHPLAKEQSRELIINSTEQLLHNINSHPDLPNYLAVNPFTFNNVKIIIVFYTPKRDLLYDPNIGVVSLYQGMVSYYTNDPDKKYTYKTVEEESYEEALKIVQSLKSKSSTPPAS